MSDLKAMIERNKASSQDRIPGNGNPPCVVVLWCSGRTEVIHTKTAPETKKVIEKLQKIPTVITYVSTAKRAAHAVEEELKQQIDLFETRKS